MDSNRIAVSTYGLPGLSNVTRINIAVEIPKIVREVTGSDPFLHTRTREVAVARQIAMSLSWLFSNQGDTLKKIAALYGKDHSTLIHAIKLMNTAVETKDRYAYPFLKECFDFIYTGHRYYESSTVRGSRYSTRENSDYVKSVNIRIKHTLFARYLAAEYMRTVYKPLNHI